MKSYRHRRLSLRGREDVRGKDREMQSQTPQESELQEQKSGKLLISSSLMSANYGVADASGQCISLKSDCLVNPAGPSSEFQSVCVLSASLATLQIKRNTTIYV